MPRKIWPFVFTNSVVVTALSLLFLSPPVLSQAATDPTSTGITDIWGGAVESIALHADGTVWTWGWDDYGILGNAHGYDMNDASTAYDRSVPSRVLGPAGNGYLESIVAIAGGERHNAALDSAGYVWSWGWNYFGQLGANLPCNNLSVYSMDCTSTTPVKVNGLSQVKAISSRGYHTLALTQNGLVYAWGYNNYGRLGDGTTVDRFGPVLISGLNGHGGVQAISGGGDVSAALMNDHSLMAWGNNTNGAVGNGSFNLTGQWTPVEVSQASGLNYITTIATGWDHMVALDQNGNVWTWGDNTDGQLGDGTYTPRDLPTRVTGISHVKDVSAGDGATVVLKEDGTVWAWGKIRHGNGDPYLYGPYPVQVAGIDNVRLVRARDWHVLAIKTDGSVWAWGSNQRGECGNGQIGGNTDTPLRVLFPDLLTHSFYLSTIRH